MNPDYCLADLPDKYFSLEEIPFKVETFLENLFFVIPVNIRSLNKNIVKLLEFLTNMKNEFDVKPISKMWYNDDSINVNLLYQIANYLPIHQFRKTGINGGALALYIHKTITFNTLEKLSNNNEHIENLSFKTIRKNLKTIISLCIYKSQEATKIYLLVKYNTSSKDISKTKTRFF